MLNVFLKKELARLKHFPFITFRPNVCEYVPNGMLPSRHNNIINFKQPWKRANFNSLENQETIKGTERAFPIYTLFHR